ncbi:unnamed protein product [Prorocentrum cordatum]|uniref:Uncharacterized protein n=1 Tax=Prorocentrum cordatum TaxID=2364126 RepID=A0ABN9SSA8_9DINO|nr:unnamed protein product [Polarella glacialis]
MADARRMCRAPRCMPEAGLRTTSGSTPGSMACPEGAGGQVEPLPLPRFLTDRGPFRAVSKQPQAGGALACSSREELRRAGAGSSAHQVREVPAELGASAPAANGPGLAGLADGVPPWAVWDGVATRMVQSPASLCHQEEVLEAAAQCGFSGRYTVSDQPKEVQLGGFEAAGAGTLVRRPRIRGRDRRHRNRPALKNFPGEPATPEVYAYA